MTAPDLRHMRISPWLQFSISIMSKAPPTTLPGIEGGAPTTTHPRYPTALQSETSYGISNSQLGHHKLARYTSSGHR